MTEDEMRAANPSCKWPDTCGRVLQCAEWLRNLKGCNAGQGASVQLPPISAPKSLSKADVQ